jgi:putative peptidoglycan lipid II flippase
LRWHTRFDEPTTRGREASRQMSDRPEAPLPAQAHWPLGTLVRRWRHVDGEHRDIVRGVAWVALFVSLGKVAAAAKEMVVAWRYGVSAEVDAYLFLFNLINWPLSLWFGLLATVLVPILAKAHGKDPDDLHRFQAELLGRTLIFGVLLAAVCSGVFSLLLNASLTGLSLASVQAAQAMILPLSLLAPLGAAAGLFSISMLARGRHANTLLESVPAVVIGISVAWAGGGGIGALTWGTLAGFGCHALTLALAVRGELYAPRLSGRSSYWPAFWTGCSIVLIGQALSSLTTLIDQFFVTQLAEGALSTLSYAQRILALIISLGATAVGRATIPVFARGTEADRERLRGVAIRWVWIVFFAGVAAVVIGWWLGPWVVRLLFERGAFTPGDTAAVVAVFRAGLIQMPFNFAAVILFYALAGRRQFGALTAIAAVAVLVKVLANAILVKVWGIDGVMFSTGLMYAALMLLYLLVLRKTNGAST